ncbi:MAG TPA: hypothetical protein VEY69_07940, partial [Lautropia sp.]|nr:hypothetical protein [Lautropia sp.]
MRGLSAPRRDLTHRIFERQERGGAAARLAAEVDGMPSGQSRTEGELSSWALSVGRRSSAPPAGGNCGPMASVLPPGVKGDDQTNR